MTDFPVPRWPPLNVITPWHPEAGGFHLHRQPMIVSAASGVLVANLVVYMPFRLYEAAVVRKLSVVVGATTGGNVDVGIYDSQKNRIVRSGSVVLGAINTAQEFDITDTPLAPGLYFMAVTLSSGTATIYRMSSPDEQLPRYAVYDETTGSFGLPDPANFALSTQADVLVPLVGVHFSTLV